ncbi:efflux transporter outer membrane subunit [Luteibacter pinisoli]|uniref:Efflux transporter outer membrane subunit n=1 Tax=Luteibacter pinisoli TaxID=2589080 RepID=A0A4Y5Z3W1_9GAMM|nr:efflux transporter outer membrane subunit [Luteibacter pinisoli]QDE39837.1 efflux transporter outer membrane subunit [Luteibacter pinisoli]
MNRLKTNRLALALIPLLGACSLAPSYQRPDAGETATFKEQSAQTAPDGTVWKAATPSDAVLRGQWWAVFADADLDGLEAQAMADNQTLKGALARVNEARAVQLTARSALFPTIGAGAGPVRQKPSSAATYGTDGINVPPQTLWRAQATATWEVDLFGRATSELNASKAESMQAEALFRSVQLALQADVAQTYFNLRELDSEIAIYRQTVALREDAVKLVTHRYDAGDITELDVARATAELATARSDQMTAERLRAASEHSLAVLLGMPPAAFSFPARPIEKVDITLPAGLPSDLLERRPDIAAAERAVAAANARIGVARAAYFPSLTLTGSGGGESAKFSNLFSSGSKVFLLGPLAGTILNLPLFDGGLRKGNLQKTHAELEESTAAYREQVLVAFQEVEDHLADLRILQTQTKTQDEAVRASTRAEAISRTQYREGAVNFLDVIDAQRSTLQSRLAASRLTGVQTVATVNLIRALGGGWDGVPGAMSGEAVSRR